MTRVAIMGSGSWGTAFGMVLADAGSDVVIWGRDTAVAGDINAHHRNDAYHQGLLLPDRVSATTDPAVALSGATLVVLAIPAQVLRENLETWRALLGSDAVLVSLMKGIELGTTKRMSEVIQETAGVGADRVAVVSGPNLAREIAERQPAATTVACADRDSARRLQDACTTDYFRPYWTTDVIGTEIGGAVKNVIALANGIAVGLGLGENSQASLITRGLAEMARLGVALGADPLTFQGLAGVGDLVATCQSPSRATGRSGRTSDAVSASTRRSRRPSRPARRSRAASRSSTSAGVMAWRCPSPSRSSRSSIMAARRG